MQHCQLFEKYFVNPLRPCLMSVQHVRPCEVWVKAFCLSVGFSQHFVSPTENKHFLCFSLHTQWTAVDNTGSCHGTRFTLKISSISTNQHVYFSSFNNVPQRRFTCFSADLRSVSLWRTVEPWMVSVDGTDSLKPVNTT